MSTPPHMPGGGRFQVGDRVRYIGAPRQFHANQRVIQTGETGVIVYDFGFDYRYLIKLDTPTDRVMHNSGVEFDIRPGNSWANWERVGDGDGTHKQLPPQHRAAARQGGVNH